MAKFVFRLQPLLEARRREERERQRDVAVLEGERRRIESEIAARQERISSSKASIRHTLTGLLDMSALRLQAGSTRHAMRDAQRLVLELAGVHKRIERARGALIEASRQRRVFERLRERRFEQWKRDLDRRESAALDDLVSAAAARKDSGP